MSFTDGAGSANDAQVVAAPVELSEEEALLERGRAEAHATFYSEAVVNVESARLKVASAEADLESAKLSLENAEAELAALEEGVN
jgi:hypothetical protein